MNKTCSCCNRTFSKVYEEYDIFNCYLFNKTIIMASQIKNNKILCWFGSIYDCDEYMITNDTKLDKRYDMICDSCISELIDLGHIILSKNGETKLTELCMSAIRR